MQEVVRPTVRRRNVRRLSEGQVYESSRKSRGSIRKILTITTNATVVVVVTPPLPWNEGTTIQVHAVNLIELN